MKTIIYLLQVSACTGIFYGFYFLLLRRLTFFTLNRWYLLVTLLVSFVIPAINIYVDTAKPPAIIQPVMYVNRIQVIDEPIKAITQTAPQQVTKKVFDWVSPVKAIYVVIAIASVMHLLFTLLIFFRRSRAERLLQIGNVKVLKGNSKQGNSSFLNVIFVNDDELEPGEVTQIIAHEMLHVKLLHSADRIIARLVQIILWFNPFAYCYIRSIEENHEFEVDRMITDNADKSIYATLLFKLSVSGQSYLMHSFSKVPLKSRIAMLFNKPTSNMKKMIYVLIAPVVLVSCLAFANLKANTTVDAVKKHSFYTGKPADTTLLDTVKTYRQKVKRTPAQQKDIAAFKAYTRSADYKYKKTVAGRVQMHILPYKVVGTVDSMYKQTHLIGYKLMQGKDEFVLTYNYGQNKTLKGLLKAGDEIQLKVFGSRWRKEVPVVIEPALIVKDKKVIFQLAETTIPKEAFLYEANKVRFTNGQVTNIKKYSNEKWKSAVVEVVNGYKIKFNLKPNAPDFKNIEWGDHITFRFIHEVKTGAKEYTVNDWISLSTDIKDYGIKNPDYFYKFYEKS
jgi:beta-lactamase regulating signal transducer with metallopeptidase domain